MFIVKEKNRRTLLRLAFLCFCVLPTVVIAAGVAWPKKQVDWSAKLSDRLGIEVAIGTSSPSDGGVQLGNIEFSDPQFGILATLRQVEATEGDDGLVLTGSDAEVRVEHLGRLLQVVDQQILRHTRSANLPVQLTIDELTLREITSDAQESRVAKLNDVICRCDITGDGTRRLRASFRHGAAATDRVEFSFARSGERGQLTEEWTLNSNGTSLPIWPLQNLLPATKHLGQQCEFRGAVWTRCGGGSVDCDINGHFSKVDLRRLVAQQFSHQLDGLAEVDLVRAHIRDGRLTDAAGSLVVSDGVIGGYLLQSAAEHLQLAAPHPIGAAAVAFGSIDLGFDIDASTLSLRGHCPVAEGVLITDQSGQPVLIESDSSVPVLSVVRMLVPNDDVLVPLTTSTARMLDVFPLPRSH